jgi:nitroreductase
MTEKKMSLDEVKKVLAETQTAPSLFFKLPIDNIFMKQFSYWKNMVLQSDETGKVVGKVTSAGIINEEGKELMSVRVEVDPKEMTEKELLSCSPKPTVAAGFRLVPSLS